MLSGKNRIGCGVGCFIDFDDSRLAPGPDFNPNWRTQETEGAADLIFEKSFIGKVQFYFAVGEQDECRRRYSCLGQVKDFHALPFGYGCAIKVNVL